jgi:hypothetical protein
METPPPGGGSAIWVVILLAILFGPFIYGIAYGILHRDSGSPKDEGTLEAPSLMQSLKDWIDTRSGGKGF